MNVDTFVRQVDTAHYLAVQYAVSHVLAEADTLDAAGPSLLEAIGEALGWDWGAFWRPDRDNSLACAATWHAPSITAAELDSVSRSMRFARGVGLPGHVWESGIPTWSTDVFADRRFVRQEAAARGDLHSAFAFPVHGRGGVLGIIEFFSHEIRFPDEVLLQSVTALGSQIGQFMERNRVQEALQARVRQQAAVAEMGQRALAGANLSVLMDAAVALVAGALEVEYSNVLELLPDGAGLRLQAGVGWKEGLVGHAIVAGGPDSEASYTLRSSKPVKVDDLATESRFGGRQLLHAHGVVSGISVTIKAGGHPYGVLGAHMTSRRRFTLDDVHFLQAIANVLGTAIERKQAEEAMRRYTERLKRLRDFDQAILAARSPEELFQDALRYIWGLMPCRRASITLYNFGAQEVTEVTLDTKDDVTMRVGGRAPLEACESLVELRGSKRYVVEDLLMQVDLPPVAQEFQSEEAGSCMRVPLIAQDTLFGSLNLAPATPHAFTSEHVDIIREVADHLALAIQNARLFEEVRAGHERLQSLSRRLLVSQEQERRRIARELHDEIGQALTAVKINLQGMQSFADTSALTSRVEESIGIVDRAIQEVRTLALDLRPSLLDDLGLVSALRWYIDRLAQRTGLEAQYAPDPLETRLSPELETACFRIVQEALTNVARHARARRVGVDVRRRDGELQVVVRDDGVGFDVLARSDLAAQGERLGLLGMQERAELAGGRLDIVSAPGYGTEIRGRFPLIIALAPVEQDATSYSR